MCHSFKVRAFAPSGAKARTSVGVPMLVPGTLLAPVTRAPISLQGPNLGSGGGTSAYAEPMADVPLLSQSTLYPGAYIAPSTWPMYMPSFLPLPQMDRPQIDLNVSY